jgi:hypothetical protein
MLRTRIHNAYTHAYIHTIHTQTQYTSKRNTHANTIHMKMIKEERKGDERGREMSRRK